jgi:ubiquinone/menaquinone biosynthesis C-methylase UbiE
MLWVLTEFADAVVGYEREPHLVAEARRRLPSSVTTFLVDDLAALPVPDSPFDLAMTCTVLQHMTDADAARVCAQLRALAPRGHVLLIEKTRAVEERPQTDAQHFSNVARSLETYDDYMRPFVRITAVPRPVDADYGSPTGTCMLYRR